MLWGVTAPAYWGDEADTVSAVSRSMPQLLRMLRHVDVVHGLYYLALWPVAKLLGAGELAMRLPSALAMAAAALGIAAIAGRLAGRRAAWCAGLLFAVYPMVSAQGHDARPYGMVTAAGVLTSYLLIRAIRVPGTGMRSVSQFLAARERPGDAVIYPGAGVPPWYLAYPAGLGRLRDIWMAGSGPATGRLYGIRVTGQVLRHRELGVCRIWAVDLTPPWPDPAVDVRPGFRLAGHWQPQPGVWLWLYQRPGCGQVPGAGR